MMNQDFDAAAYEAFKQAALDKYDFTTCQRPDGSKYGSNGRCIKGSETSPASKDDKKGSSKSGGGGGGATLDKASRAEYGKQAKREQQSAADIKSEMKRNGKTPELEKKLKQTEARAAKFERMSKTGVFEPAKKASGGGSNSGEYRTRPKGAIESDMKKLTSSGAMNQKGTAGVKAREEHAKLKAELKKPLKGANSKSGTGTKQQPKKDPFAKHNAMAKKEEARLRKKYANKKPDGGLTEAQVRAGGGRLD